MTPEQFKEYWTLTYPGAIPISHYLKWDYPDRWFRIHSLPGSKRYADNDKEWHTLLHRQNTIINDLIGEGATFCIITGDYGHDNNTGFPDFIKEDGFLQKIYFKQLDPIDMHSLSTEEYDEGIVYRPVMAIQAWYLNRFNPLLKDIANDRTRAIFMGVTQKCLILPYDGGMDIILESETVRNYYKEKYKDWLSERDDGM